MKTSASSALTESPRLAAPGAGLPKPELFAARLIFGWYRSRATRESAAALIVTERDALLALTRSLSKEAAARPTLIPRLRGLEDSSRNWSVFMTLEHLRIVNADVAEAIALLAQGRVPERVVSTAAVKPAAGIGPEVVAAFAAGCAALAATVAGVAELRTQARYAHPWFGPLDAAGWHAMAGFHLRLHRKQVEQIAVALRSA
jgi:DinB superfamily